LLGGTLRRELLVGTVRLIGLRREGRRGTRGLRGRGEWRALNWTRGSCGRAGSGACRGDEAENEPWTSVRITDRDRLAVADVDGRHAVALDEDASGAPIDGYPLVTSEPQHHIRARCR
jgi:hypothetical protein